jgi:hypothetical protein
MDQANALVAAARNGLDGVVSAYKRSLADQVIGPAIQVPIKTVLEHLRSALDYSAREVYEQTTTNSMPPKAVYFPIARRGACEADFPSLVHKQLPGIMSNLPDVYACIRARQSFAVDDPWLADLATLCNENKHERLTPQRRVATHQLTIQSGGAGIVLTGGASIRMSSGASIRMGKMTIPGGQDITPTSPLRTTGSGTTERTTWIGFQFADLGRDVIAFLKVAVDGAEKTVEDLALTL